MPFNRPTLTEHHTRILRDMQLLPGVTNVTRFSVLGVFAKVLAGMAYLHDSYLDWIARQGVPWTAEGENLESWGDFKNIHRKPSSFASGYVTFYAVQGSEIPAGCSVSLGGNGMGVTTQSTVAGDNGTITVPVTFNTAGSTGNFPSGTIATLVNPVIGVQSQGSVSEAFTGGADAEQESEYRNRVIASFSAGGRNGRQQDYIDWALEVPGITRAWVDQNGFNVGSVVVYIMLDDTYPDGFPVGTNGGASQEMRWHQATGDQLIVANHLYDLRPVTALVIVCAPVKQSVDFEITELGNENTSDNQTAITNALKDVFRRLGGLGETIYPSAWNAALDALNLAHYSVTSPAGPIKGQAHNHLLVLGNITFRG